MKISLQPFLFVFSFLLVILTHAQNSVDFSVSKQTGCGALANIQFTDLSTGSINSWLWDFGNNSTANIQNPTASFNSPGLYTVTLTVTGPNGSLVETKNSFIKVYNRPTSNFSPSITSGCAPLEVQFSNSSTIGDTSIKRYIWDFGDGSPENNQKDPFYTYNSSGNFSVSLQVIDSNNCFDTKVFNSIQVEDRPIASFSSSNSSSHCSAPYTVNFVNYTQSSSTTTYIWDFGDGNTSTQTHPSYTYSAMGKYDVTLIAKTSLCSDTITLFDFVSLEPISAQFSTSSKQFCLNDTVFFRNNSTGASNFQWSFGDGSSSNARNPFHIYADSGKYVVKLVSSSGSTCVAEYTDTIYIQKVIADFNVLADTSCNLPSLVTFSNNSINATTFKWLLGNIEYNSFTLSDTTFSVFQLGNIDDTLIAMSSIGCIDTLAKPHNRFIYNPTPIFNISPMQGCDTLNVNFSYIPRIDSIVQQDWSIRELPGVTSTSKNFQHSFTQHGEYTIKLETVNARGCISLDSTEIKVGKKFDFDIDFPDTICTGELFYFIKHDIGFPANEIQLINIYWPDLTVIDSEELDDDTTNYQFRNSGTAYIEHKIIYNGCTSYAYDTVFVLGSIASFTVTAYDCQSLTFDFQSRMVDADKFYWDFGDGSPLDSINLNPTHTFPFDSTFTVTLTTNNLASSCGMTYTYKVEARPPPSPVILVPDTNVVCANDTIFLNSTVYGNYDSLRWVMNDSIYSDSSSIYFSVDSAFKDTVYLFALNNNGCFGTDYLVIEFHKPQPDFTTDYTGGCLPLHVNFINNTQSEVDIVDWRWEISPFGKDSIFEPFININQSMVVNGKLTVTDTLGCTNTIEKDSVLVIEKNNLIFWTSNRQICLGDTVEFENFSNTVDSNYIWHFGDGDSLVSFNSSHVYQQAGEYTVSLSFLDNQGCNLNLSRTAYVSVEDVPIADFVADTLYSDCTPLPVNFTDISGDTTIIDWKWDFGDGITSYFQNPFHSYTKPGKFDVKLEVETKNGCVNSLLKPEYIETSGPTAEIKVFPDTACINSAFTFEMLNPIDVANYQWSLGDSTTSNSNPTTHIYNITGLIPIELTISDSANNCSYPIKDTVFIYETKADFTASKINVCIGEEIEFINNSIGFNEINWDFGDGNSSTLLHPEHTYNTTGNFIVKLRIDGPYGCIDTIVKTIIVNPLPNITVLPDTHICIGDTVQLMASGGESYVWSPNNFLSDASVPNPFAFPDTTTLYTVVARNNFNCLDSASVNVNVPMPPSIDLPNDTNIIIGEYLDYINADLGPQYIYSWSPSKGLSCNDCPNPIAKPLETTLYILNVKDPFGCYSIYDSLLIEVKVDFSLNVPNAFTPNGDGNNDVIYAKGWGIKELKEFKIYNRWGEVVFETSDINIGWDGTYKGKQQDIETYVYTISALMYNEEIISKKGNISLLR